MHFDKFGAQALDRMAWERRGSRNAFVRTAALYYLAESDRDRMAWWALPRPRRAEALEPSVGVAVDEDTWGALRREAEQQGIDPGRLAEHAVLYYLADLDSGRVAARVADSIEANR